MQGSYPRPVQNPKVEPHESEGSSDHTEVCRLEESPEEGRHKWQTGKQMLHQ